MVIAHLVYDTCSLLILSLTSRSWSLLLFLIFITLLSFKYLIATIPNKLSGPRRFGWYQNLVFFPLSRRSLSLRREGGFPQTCSATGPDANSPP